MRKHNYLVGTALVAAGALAAPAAASEGGTPSITTVLVSVDSAEHQGNNISGRSSRPAVSGSGAFVAFDSIANNLVRDDTNHADDVFVRDRASGKTTRVSVNSAAEQGNGDSSLPDVSKDGRLVVFDSTASNLVDGDTNNTFDVFVHDRVTHRTSLVSRASDGGSGDAGSSSPVISANGVFVAFMSNASNLTRKPSPGSVFVRNLRTSRTAVVSVRPDGTSASGSSPSLSATGRYVAFSSFASDIVPGDTNDAFDVFVRDRRLHQTTRVSVTTGGAQAEGGGSSRPAISGNGERVAFDSEAANLVPDDTNGARDIFVHDTGTATTERVSVASDGTQADGQSDGPGIRGGLTFGPDISADGPYVTFDSIASNLVADDTNTCSYTPGGQSYPEPGECPDVFVRDLLAGTTTRVSVSTAGQQADDASTDPAISSDGRTVVFFTTASFAPDDTNTCAPFFFSHPGQCPDIYLHTR